MILSVANIKKTINYCKKNGVKEAFYTSLERVIQGRNNKYSYLEPTEDELEFQLDEINSFPKDKLPKISLLVPAYETKPIYIEDLVISVEEQTYLNLELIIADASESDCVERMVKDLMTQYDNIVYKRLENNEGISGNSNQALELVTGDYVALVDHDDLITKDALFYFAKEIMYLKDKNIAPVLIYSDEDKTDSYLEKFYEANIKLGINKSLILTNNYVCHLSMIRTDVIKMLKFRPEYDGAQDFDLVLRCINYVYDNYGEDAKILKEYIRHIPKVLYHWRCHEASTAENPQSKLYAYEAGKRAVQNFLDGRNIEADVVDIKHLGFYRVLYKNGPFAANKKLGVVGGPIYKNNMVVSGAIDGKGRVVYSGLNIHFSGYLNRADLQQNVDVLDIRNIILRDEYQDLFKESTGYSYPLCKEELGKDYFDDGLMIKKSSIFCNKLRTNGIEIMYDPEMKLELK